MSLAHALRRRIRAVAAPLIGALLIVYFGYHAIEGDRGLFAYLRLNQEIRKAEVTLDLIRAERKDLEHRVNLMRAGSLDRDMLDEQARATLGLGRPDEVTILLDPLPVTGAKP